MHEPQFWWRAPGVVAALMSPLAALYSAFAERRLTTKGERGAVPIICVGNFTLGGSGKTPAAIALANLLTAAGRRPALLSRGYGGTTAGPLVVDRAVHTAADVGDEALLLAQTTTTVVSRDRLAGARKAREAGADVVVMDDGLQNPSLVKDLAIGVVDGRRGVGNGQVFPAGPLRVRLSAQLRHCHAILIVGDNSGAQDIIPAASERNLPVFHATLEPDQAALKALAGRKLLAFAGIGNPDKFFATLAFAGLATPVCMPFPDHHLYTAEEAGSLIMQAEHEGLRLVTTEKDHARLVGNDALAALASRTHVIPVKLKIAEEAAWQALVLEKIAQA
jgi:tetraacyldisaccharide 4'-kinase